jgi:xanthine dehydrogenase YagS FAD-binding subunit
MEPFRYTQAKLVGDAISGNTAEAGAKFIAGGTTLIDLMKLNVERPTVLIDINRLPLARIESAGDGGLTIGAMVRNSDLANHEIVRKRYPVLSQALLSGASPQLRNMATTGGNLLQRTRCYYFRDTAYTACNKRNPGSGCGAIDGYNRMHAILGTSEQCVATHPSDMAVAMMALEATVHTESSKGKRHIPIEEFYLLPGNAPQRETVLEPGELLTFVTLPPLVNGTRSYYLKLRDRAAYEFALSSAAVVIQMNGSRLSRVRIALGGIGTKPWRSHEAERALENHVAGAATFKAAASAGLQGARPLHDNAFKVELAKRCLIRALRVATTVNG